MGKSGEKIGKYNPLATKGKVCFSLSGNPKLMLFSKKLEKKLPQKRFATKVKSLLFINTDWNNNKNKAK